MKKKIGWILAGLLMVSLLGWVFRPRPIEVDVASVTQGRFERAIEEDGKTRLRERYIISAPLTGRIARLVLQEGDVVQKGALLATLSPTAPAFLDARTEDELRARVGAIEASSRRAGVALERASVALDQANIELRRSETLARQGFVSPTQNESARLNVRLREKELQSARQDEDAARHELEQARAALRQYAQPSKGGQGRVWEVRAPVGGSVLKVIQRSEGNVLAGAPLLEIGDQASLEMVADILTSDATQVAPGMPVRMGAGNGDNELTGRVRLIEPAAFTKISALGVEEQRVKAVIDIVSPREKWQNLGDGFFIEVRILVQIAEDAIKVPVSAVYPIGNQSGVFVIEAGRARQRRVEIAARNSVEGWVKQGLESGTPVILYPPTALEDGARVVVRQRGAGL